MAQQTCDPITQVLTPSYDFFLDHGNRTVLWPAINVILTLDFGLSASYIKALTFLVATSVVLLHS